MGRKWRYLAIDDDRLVRGLWDIGTSVKWNIWVACSVKGVAERVR